MERRSWVFTSFFPCSLTVLAMGPASSSARCCGLVTMIDFTFGLWAKVSLFSLKLLWLEYFIQQEKKLRHWINCNPYSQPWSLTLDFRIYLIPFEENCVLYWDTSPTERCLQPSKSSSYKYFLWILSQINTFKCKYVGFKHMIQLCALNHIPFSWYFSVYFDWFNVDRTLNLFLWFVFSFS